MRNLILLAASAALLAGCASGGIANRKSPDEFAVSRQAPLVIPPDYALAPPKPGDPRPIANDSQQQALEALFGPGVQLPPKSPLENRMLLDAGAARVDSAIRNTATNPGGAQGTVVVDKGEFLRELMDAPATTRNPDVARVTVPG